MAIMHETLQDLVDEDLCAPCHRIPDIPPVEHRYSHPIIIAAEKL